MVQEECQCDLVLKIGTMASLVGALNALQLINRHFVAVFMLKVRAGAFSGFLPGGGRVILRGWRKSPRGWRKKCALPPSAFDILDTCYKEIHKIYSFYFFLFVFYLLYASLIPRNVLCLEGVKIPSNGQGVASPPPETLRGWRGGPRHPLEIASGQP